MARGSKNSDYRCIFGGMKNSQQTGFLSLSAVLGLLVAITVSSAAIAQDPGGDELVMVAPKGWHPAHQNATDDAYEITYVKDGETAADWTEAARAQIFFNLSEDKPELTPADFVENMRRYYEQTCQSTDASPVSTWDDHGYSAAIRLIVCGRQRGEELGSVTMIKVIRGRTSMFLLDRSWRGPAFETDVMPVPQEMLDEWSDFLARSFLCNRKNPDTPCPGTASQ